MQDTATSPVEQGPSTPQKYPRSARVKRWFDDRRNLLFWWALSLVIAIILLWPQILINIQPGHVGVLYRRFLGGTEMNSVFREGTHLIFPWDRMFIFDSRLREEMHTLNIQTTHGLPVEMDVSVIYHPLAEKTPVLLTTVGVDYRQKLVIPMLKAAVRGVAATYDIEDFYSKTSLIMQDEMQVALVMSIGRNPVVIDNLVIRKIVLSTAMNEAIAEKYVAQQKVFRQQFMVKEAAETYKRKFIEAQAVRMAQELVNEKMSAGFLRWLGIEATRSLAESPNSKLVIVGGKDGLPLILNPDGATESGGKPLSKALSKPPLADKNAAAPLDDEQPGQGQTTPALPVPADAAKTKATSPPAGYMDRINSDSLEKLSAGLERYLGVPLYYSEGDKPQEKRQPGQP